MAHLAPGRLAASDPTPAEEAHLRTCARCRHAARQLAGFLHDAPADEAEEAATGAFASPAEPPPGRGGGRFREIGALGAGGMAVVSLARDELLGRDVARKSLRPGTRHAAAAARFVREARITAQLEHPNIVPIYDLGADPDGSPVLTMRVVRGTSLTTAVSDGALPGLVDRLEVFLKVCDAVSFAHSRGVVHRDLKPDNIMVGEFGQVQVMDFGLASRSTAGKDEAAPGGASDPDPAPPPDGGLTRVGEIMGTPAYMSPEQARGDNDAVGVASDVYSLGATLWFLLVGAPPFEGAPETAMARVRLGELRPPRSVDRSVPPDLDAVVLRAMAHSGDARYPSARALRADVAAFLADRPVSARSASPADKARKWFARNRSVALPVGVTAAIAAVGLVATLASGIVRAQVAQADALLAEARSELVDRPRAAEVALLEARRIGSGSQQAGATLALDALAGIEPRALVTLPGAPNYHGVVVSPGGREVSIVTRDLQVRRFTLPGAVMTGSWAPESGVVGVGAGWLADGRWVRLEHDQDRSVRMLDEAGGQLLSFAAGNPSIDGRVELLPGGKVAIGAWEGTAMVSKVYGADGRTERQVVSWAPWGAGAAWITGQQGSYGVEDGAGHSLWAGPPITAFTAIAGDRVIAATKGRRLEAFSIGSGAKLWAVASGAQAAEHTGGDAPPSPPPAFDLVAAPSSDETVDVRSVVDGRRVARLGTSDTRDDNAWSEPLRLLLLPTDADVSIVPVGPAASWDAPAWQPGDEDTATPPDSAPIAISPDGTLVASTPSPGTVEVRSRGSRGVLARLPLDLACPGGATPGLSHALRFLDGEQLAAGCEHAVVVFDLAGGATRAVPTPGPVTAIVGLPEGLLATTADGSLVTEREGVVTTTRLHPGKIWDAELDGGVLVTTGRQTSDRSVRAWSWPALEPIWSVQLPDVPYQVDARRGVVAVVTEGGELVTLDEQTGDVAWRASASATAVLGVAIADDGVIFTSSIRGEVRAWGEAGDPLWLWPGAEESGFQVATAGSLVAVGFDGGATWRLERGLHDRVAKDGPASTARRYLAARAPEQAAACFATVPRELLTREERLLLVEQRLDPVATLTTLGLSVESEHAWRRLVQGREARSGAGG